MAISYKLCKNTNQKSDYVNMYYGRVHTTGMVGLEEIAEAIQQNCTLKRSDVNAVIYELVEQLEQHLLAGEAVKIAGLGTFKPSIKTVYASSPKTFNVQENVKKVGIKFTPEWKVNNGVRVTPMIQKARLKELEEYQVK